MGNRQLLTGFFIGVLLLGAAFAMGYSVGQNSPRAIHAQTETAAAAAVETPAIEAAPGSYWQVKAVPQADADVVAQALRDKGFPATLTPGPNNLVRVLVGPYKDTKSMGRAKTELEDIGFRPFRK